MYKIVGTVESRAGRVIWMLEELGLPYDHVPAKPRSDQAIAANPAGKVPVLFDGDTAITDSTAILQYLADKHGALTYPAGTLDRARQDSFANFLLDEFDACLWTAARHSFILPVELRVPAVKDTLKWEFQRSQKVLVDRMGAGPFLMGEKMTVPDIILTECLAWSQNARFPMLESGLSEYLARMQARPAFQRAMTK
jgi:glutathione S-transferase